MKTQLLLLSGAMTVLSLNAQIIQVPEDYPTIQQGIDAANPGDTVLVAEGIYYEQINFLGKKPLLVASHFIMDNDTSHISNTIIDGSQLTNTDMASVVYFTSGEDTTSIICGFTIRGGKGTFVTSGNNRCGGGIYVSGSGAKIIHNKITGNLLDDTQPVNGQNVFGGGIGTRSEYGDYWLVIEHNQIVGNSVISQFERACGGGIHSSYHCRIYANTISGNSCSSSSTACQARGGGFCHTGGPEAVNIFIIRSNKFLNNIAEAPSFASGAALLLNASQLSFNYNDVIGNQSITQSGGPAVGGLSYQDPSTVNKLSNNITHNLFDHNVGRSGGGAIYLVNWAGIPDPDPVVISDNYFIDNEGVNGGAIVSWSSPFTLVNNIFKGNYASLRGGALFLDNAGALGNSHLVTMINNSFWKNESGSKGGAIFSNKARPLIFNSVFYEDSAVDPSGREIYLNFPSDTLDLAFSNLDQSNIYGYFEGWGGNINADPEYQDDTCHINENSPCEDFGAVSVTIRGEEYSAPEYDFKGTPRPWHMGIDMGADECDVITGLPRVGPNEFAVSCFPNPTNGMTEFQFSNFNFQRVTLKIYDVQGREVSVVLDEPLPAGEHTVKYDVSWLPPGIYYYRLTANGQRPAANGQRLTANGKLVKY